MGRARGSQQDVPGGEAARLREAIDSGETGDKVANPDPAAAPLGTDDEAAGTPPPARAVRRSAEEEIKAVSRDPGGEKRRGYGRGALFVLLAGGIVAVVALLLLAGLL